jgi:hypothetical protein
MVMLKSRNLELGDVVDEPFKTRGAYLNHASGKRDHQQGRCRRHQPRRQRLTGNRSVARPGRRSRTGQDQQSAGEVIQAEGGALPSGA